MFKASSLWGHIYKILLSQRGGSLKTNILKENMKLNWNFQKGGRFKPKNLPWEGGGHEYFLNILCRDSWPIRGNLDETTRLNQKKLQEKLITIAVSSCL